MKSKVSVVIMPSLSLSTIVAVAISDSTTISTNPPMALTSVTIATTLKPNQHIYNSTDYFVEQDELEYNILAAFSDMQTVFLACISTLLPLIIVLAIAFGVRHTWQKYIHRRNGTCDLPWYNGVSSRDDTVESLDRCSHSADINIQSTAQILSVQDLVNNVNESRYTHGTAVMDEVAFITSDEFTSPESHTSKNTNGNIITLTLKNNHLIVETEERTVSMENDSFIVEMQPEYIRNDGDENVLSTVDVTSRVIDQQALIHQEEIAEDSTAECEKIKIFGSINAGLSQSDLSISGENSLNRYYCNGNQVEYEANQIEHSLCSNNLYHGTVISHKCEGGLIRFEFDKISDVMKVPLKEYRIDMDFNKSPSDHKKYSNIPICLDSNLKVSRREYTTDTNNSTDKLKSDKILHMNGLEYNDLEFTHKNNSDIST